MSNIQQMVTRLTELERVRANLQKYSYYEDLGSTIALALKYVGGTTEAANVVRELADALDAVIREQKDKIRQDLDD